MKKFNFLLAALFVVATLSNLNAQREEILLDGGTVSKHFGAITVTHTPGEDSPESTTAGAILIGGGAWNNGEFSDDVDNFVFQDIDLVDGRFTYDYKTDTATDVFRLSLSDWDGAAVTTFLTLASEFSLIADGEWHTMVVPYNTDWETGVVGAGLAFETTDAVDPRIIFQFGNNSGDFYIDNFVYNAPASVDSVMLDSATLTLSPAGTYTLVETVYPIYASDVSVSWATSDAGVASVVDGLVTGVGAGNCDIVVTTTDGSFTDTCKVTVSLVPVSGVSIDSTTLTMDPGDLRIIEETVAPANAADQTVSWVSSDTTVAKVEVLPGPITRVTAIGGGTCNITVTTTDGGFTAVCAVTVSDINVTGVTLSPVTIELGQVDTLVPVVAPVDATDQTMSVWMTSDNAVCGVTMDDAGGIIEGKAVGTADISVWTTDGNFTATATVTVIDTVTVGISEFASNVEVFPVPAKSIMTISNALQVKTIEIIDMTGRVVLSTINEEAVKEINIEALKPGSYVLNLIGDTENSRRTIIIE